MACSFSIFASENSEDLRDGLVEVETKASTVEVEIQRDPNNSYLDRRNTFGFVFESGYEAVSLPQFISPSLGSSFSSVYGGSPIGMFKASLGLKWNLRPVALTLEGSYGQGMTSNDQSGTATDLNITKTSLGVGFWFDSIWKTPYVVPYAKVEAYNISYEEDNSIADTSDATGYAALITGGILIDLDFLDPDSSRTAYVETNLKSVYVDIFVNHREKGASDVNFANNIDYGAALRIEY